MSPDSAGGENGSERVAKARRIRLACLRCQTRKIKCDNSIPKCSACRRAGAECLDGRTTTQEGAISRSEATLLRERIQQLEEALESRGQSINPTDGGLNLDNFATSNHTPRTQADQRPNIESDLVLAHNSATHVQQTPVPPRDSNEVVHEIGLIPLSAGINKYVGPSSGFPFAKLLFARADQAGLSPQSNHGGNVRTTHESSSTSRSRSAFTILPSSLPSTVEQALQLSKVYFEHVHFQYPFLHAPSHYRRVYEVYDKDADPPRVYLFQVTMVLAISAVILSKRLRIPFTGEGLCAAAMEHVNKIDLHDSIAGVQCLLLISMFTLHSPYLSINPWYINYQCLAAVLDLGLQRDVPTSAAVTSFEREMRTRIFWVIYSLDRILATTLGRPIGLRDEGCDLRLPLGIEDTDFNVGTSQVQAHESSTQSPGPMACSTTLFRLAHLNSEIKYILYSVNRDLPKYTYPQITDIQEWQNDLWERLQGVQDSIPDFTDEDSHLSTICRIRCCEIAMLLFRPTPRIRTPTSQSLRHCHESAKATIGMWKELYETDKMSYSWITIHSVCMSAITLLYCIWMAPEIAASAQIDVLASTMRDSSNLLSIAGEHWVEARRSRNSLDDLTAATVRWLLDARTRHSTNQGTEVVVQQAGRLQMTPTPSHGAGNSGSGRVDQAEHDTMFPTNHQPGFSDGIDTYINYEDFAMFVGAPGPFTNNFSDTLGGMFSEYQPFFEFGALGDNVGASWLG